MSCDMVSMHNCFLPVEIINKVMMDWNIEGKRVDPLANMV